VSAIEPRSKEMRFLRTAARVPVDRTGSLVAPAMGTAPDERPTFYIETYGCQMNDYDSEFIASRFLEEGYAPAPTPESADAVFFNTCSVRQSAEDRVSARIENFSGLKRARPDLLIGVVGCMAQRLGEKLKIGRNGLVDIVAGTDTYRDLPHLVDEHRRKLGRRERIVRTDIDSDSTYAIESYPRPLEGPVGFLTIMQGCDKFCTFCIAASCPTRAGGSGRSPGARSSPRPSASSSTVRSRSRCSVRT
jgi:tRNA-2-methylthio-N6-dimethylallyladenosine synthase